jgi:acetyltransferase EpsM
MMDRFEDKPKIAIWGASGHAMVVADIVRLCRTYAIEGFLDNIHPERRGTIFCGAAILGGQEQLDALRARGVGHIILGFGDGPARLRLAEVVRDKGFSCPSLIHPRAIVAQNAAIGPGTVVAAGAVINPEARIGAHAIVNTCASVDHECVVEDGAHICPGARLAGRVFVGYTAWIGIGATVIERVQIGPAAYIGAGAVVVRDIPAGAIAYGVPARVVKERPDR